MKKNLGILVLSLFSLCLIFLGKPVYAAESSQYDQTATTEWEILESYDEDFGYEYDDIDVTFSLNYPTYNGKAQTPAITVTTESGTQLTQGVDYTVSYANNINAGMNTATATVTGIGNYSNTNNITTISFSIRPSKVTGLKKTKSTAPLSNKLTWKKASGVDGYLVYRSTKKTTGFTQIAQLTSGSYTAYQDADVSLKKGKTYYYQVYSYVSEGDDSNDGYDYENNIDYSYSDSEFYGIILAAKSKTVKIKTSSKTKEKYYPIYSGDADLDYAAEQICKKIIKKSMSADEKVKAIYKWICKNFEHVKNMNEESVASKYKVVYNFSKYTKKAAAYEKKIMKKVYKGKAYLAEEDYQIDRARIALTYRKGSCSYINRVFKLLCNHVGVTCGIAGGNPGYTNSKGNTQEHYFCYARTNGKYYWYDADIGTTVTRKHGKICYDYYKQKTKVWKKNYSWKGNGYYPYKVPGKIQ